MSKKTKEEKDEQLHKMRHSLAHIMAEAVQSIFPEVKFGIGPVIENGFYYDFDLPRTLIPEDLPLIEVKMQEIIKQKNTFERKEVSKKEAAEFFKKANEPYKLELIEELNDGEITLYKSGQFVDLCKGPHVDNTSQVGAFKLTHIAGAYWRGDEKNKMLQRIYGVAFTDKKELKAYLTMVEEAKKRDHREIGKKLDLFSFHDEGPGFAFWHNKGNIILQELYGYMRQQLRDRDYEEIITPPILNEELWHRSGHWDKFRENMYFTNIDDRTFAIKPMNCPGGLLIYNNSYHSYKELPIRNAEFGLVHRHEPSGTLHGLFRVRSFTQDDAHSFCTAEQLQNEIIEMINFVIDVYSDFGFKDYQIYIATKPEKYIGEDNVWDMATSALEESLQKRKLDYELKPGEGAFYGPKIEFNIKDCLGRNWQLGTIQVDFSMPLRFNAYYIDENGDKKTPIMLHRAILGSMERFVAILIEHYAGIFPLWLAPEQVRVIPVSAEKHLKYAKSISDELKKYNFRVKLDDSAESVGKKIRNADQMKVNYMIVVGDKDIEGQTVSVRPLRGEDMGAMKLDEFIELIKKERGGREIKK
ncbi:MAG TPA: threonine--tRNA ligase [bacterium]|nr:threonine--tRNA ligase [bacterium]